ncbi:U11/U12 small nuclear ribonucleoprotein 48 kDa protein-like [Actinia tenebrosa]|uniref:U11/U12 small nuclear ribonucleoprotein 48 kDa protein-like n=1 Tax=Actinia tenebrosa TaxID=6105 RepID=A0A6P8I1G6_ACTTE|nr:U11/U12 small nuclear ribonucleoprotein 48 kDa protein-like [Actinia tenebrosa]
MERVQTINDISTFLEKSREDLYQILDKIGWDKEGLEKDAKKAVCPIDSSHVMPSSSLADHIEKCRLKKEFVDPKEVCPSSHFFYKNSLAVVPVLIDKKKYESFKCIKKEPDRETSAAKDGNKPWECIPSNMDDIVEGAPSSPHLTTKYEQSNIQNTRPNAESAISTAAQGKTHFNGEDSLQDVQTSSDLQLPMPKVQFDLSSEQRLAVYDYVVQTAKAIKRRAAEDELEELQNIAENTGDERGGAAVPKSHLDTLAEMRDYKRRRQSYRAKNVHMTKRSNIEVMRDLIETQMKMLEELNQDEDNKSTKEGQRTRFDQDDDEDTSRIERSRERRKEERHRNRDSEKSSRHTSVK